MADDSYPIPFVRSGSYPVRSGNRVRPLVDGIPAFRSICEAIEAATIRVWVTVTFMWPTFQMPDGRGTALDVLDKAASRGIDVRLIFWRPDTETIDFWPNAFWGSDDHIRPLEMRRSRVQIRWDKAHPGFCQHQKSWLIDADTADAVAFVGGINLNPNSMVAPGHQGEGQNHDVYVQISGPSTVDVHHNFVQRWNEASERLVEGGHWGDGSESDLSFPTRIPAHQGNVHVQIQRTIHAGRYTNGEATPEGFSFNVASGEQSIFDQYCAAIDAARNSIYIENQYVTVPGIVACLHHALSRGVEVVLLLPAEPSEPVRYVTQEQRDFYEVWTALATFENFTVAGIAGLGLDGKRKPVYVHAKLMIIDDEWATVGSCNLHRYSLFGNGEMNATFTSPDDVHKFRCELLQEHLGEDTSHLDDRTALQTFRKVAMENRVRFNEGNHLWQGLAFALNAANYGQ